MTTRIRVYLLFVFSLLFTVSGAAFADSDKHHDDDDKHHSKRYFLAPDVNASGTVVNGVDVATGRLNRSDVDLSSATLSLSRVYDGSNWNHQYANRLWVDGLRYSDWQGTKSRQYKKKKKACTKGWKEIKSTVFNGKLSNASAKYKKGFCQIRVNGKTKATLAIHRSGKKAEKSIVLTRPDGTSMTFAKDDHQWKTVSGVPYTLRKSGKNWKISTPNNSVEVYDRWGSLIKVTNSSGQSTRLRYSHAGKLKKVIGPFGRTLTFIYNGWKVASVTGALGTVSYTYNNAQLSSVTKVDGSTMSYQYDSGKLSSVVDALGQTIATYAYDNKGRVASYEGQNGTLKTNYDYARSATTVTNIANNAADHYQFRVIKGTMKLAKTTDVDGNITTQSYDKNGYPRMSVAVNGTKTQTVFNKNGLLVKRTQAVGLASEKTTITQWHKKFRKPILQVDGKLKIDNKATQSVYNHKGLLVKRVEGVIARIKRSHKDDDDEHHGKKKKHKKDNKHRKITVVLKDKRITKYRYNGKGLLTKTIAPNGAITLTSYDKNGNRTASSNALGQENKTLSFDATGKPLVTEDANGIQTENNYDSAGRLISSTTNGRTTIYTYDVAGRQTSISNSDGSTTTNEYDASGNLTKTVDQDGNISESAFDSNGNQTSTLVKDADGNITLSSSSIYNNKNQLVQSTDAQGNTTSYEYDASGNQTIITDTKGNSTQNQYDANNRLIKTIDALGGETHYEYDINGNRTKVIAPNGATTTFEYDAFNQLVKEVSPDRGTTTYEYDVSGNQIKVTDANGNTKRITYDILNRKTGESWDGHPDLTIAYEYDSCRIGSLCKTTDKSGSTTLTYDSEGKVTQKDSSIEGVTLSLKYTYTDDDKLQSITYPSGKVISYSYNVDKINAISIDGNPFITDINYNAANQLTGWTWSDGTAYTKTYDANGRLASFPLGNQTRTLAYDTLGNITGWSDTGTDEAKSFAYDALNRLTDYHKANTAGTLQSQGFSYDANGNRLELQDDSIPTVYSILANSNRLTEVGATHYQYDANGNITDDGEHTYTYDARNRLVGVDGTSTYLFNANNMRVKKTTPAGTVLYGWDNDRIFAEYDQNGNPIQETVYFGSTPVALLKDGNVYRIFADQIDTPRVITDSNNTTLWAWDSKPFGETAPDEDVDGDSTKLSYNLRFPGQYYDVETGKHYNFNRDYNPVTGRYVQSDPIGLDGNINTFLYSNANTLTYFDTNGLYTLGEVSSWWDSDGVAFDKWLAKEKRNLWNWLPKIPRCPRKITVRNKTAYNPDSKTWNDPGNASQRYHKGATFEMRSKPVQGDHGNQCTYNVLGNVIRWLPAAGSADYQTGVWWNVYDHYWHDVDTFEVAEKLNRIRDYFSVRPVWTY